MEELPNCHYQACKKPLPEQKPSQRPRKYCNSTCRQLAHRVRQKAKKKEQVQAQWKLLPKGAQDRLLCLVDRYGEEAGQEALATIQACFERVEWSKLMNLYRLWY